MSKTQYFMLVLQVITINPTNEQLDLKNQLKYNYKKYKTTVHVKNNAPCTFGQVQKRAAPFLTMKGKRFRT